jgi:hypothetical protein
MLVNEYKLFGCRSIQKSSKDAKFGQCLYLGENGVEIIFNKVSAVRETSHGKMWGGGGKARKKARRKGVKKGARGED